MNDARNIRQYLKHVIKQGDAHIILIAHNLADVFTGKGWANRSRYRLMNGRWCYVSGVRLTSMTAALLP